VLRIAMVPIVAERLRGNALTARVIILGLVTAAVAMVIVIVKASVGH
jgi:hypothetical protein